MDVFVVYIVKVALCLTVLYLPYTLMLRHESFFRINRLALLAIVAVSLAIPFLQVDMKGTAFRELTQHSAAVQQRFSHYVQQSQQRLAANSQAVTIPAGKAGHGHAAPPVASRVAGTQASPLQALPQAAVVEATPDRKSVA